MKIVEESLRSQIADHLVEIEDLFSRPVKVTCIVRVPGNDEADVLVTSETNLDSVISVVNRSRKREPITGGA